MNAVVIMPLDDLVRGTWERHVGRSQDNADSLQVIPCNQARSGESLQ